MNTPFGRVTLLIVLILIVYGNSFSNVFISDDIGIIAHVKNPEWVWSHVMFLRPLVYYLTYLVGNMHVFFYHAGNILFHIGVVVLLYSFTARMTNHTVALISSLLFSVHPILTESVTWISGGVYTQYSFFMLLALIFYSKVQRHRNTLLTTLAFSLALFSSEKAIVLPLILTVYELLFGNIKKYWKTIALTSCIAILFGLLTLTRFGDRIDIVEQTSGIIPRWDNPIIHIATATTKYLELIAWPKTLTLYHSDVHMNIWETMTRVFIFFGLVATIVVTYKKNRPMCFWLAFFLLSLLPVLSPYRITWIIAERYIYLGTMGITTLVALTLSYILKNKKIAPLVWMFVLILVSALGLRTIKRNTDWNSDETFWKATVLASPHEPKAHNSMSSVYANQKKFDRAIQELEIAIQLRPGYAPAYYNLGLIYEALGNPQKALFYFEEALKRNSIDPAIRRAIDRIKQDSNF